MGKHISEVELCDDSTCENYHRDDFCLLCGYELEGDRLYMEIHGPNGWDAKTRQIDSAQPYVCMECAADFETYIKRRMGKGYKIKRLFEVFKEGNSISP